MDFHDSKSISTAAGGDTTLIAGVAAAAANPQDTPAKRIYVGGYTLLAAGAVTVQFKSSGGTLLSGVMSLIVGTPLTVGFGGSMVFAPLPAGEGLVITLGGAVQVSGHAVFNQI